MYGRMNEAVRQNRHFAFGCKGIRRINMYNIICIHGVYNRNSTKYILVITTFNHVVIRRFKFLINKLNILKQY